MPGRIAADPRADSPARGLVIASARVEGGAGRRRREVGAGVEEGAGAAERAGFGSGVGLLAGAAVCGERRAAACVEATRSAAEAGAVGRVLDTGAGFATGGASELDTATAKPDASRHFTTGGPLSGMVISSASVAITSRRSGGVSPHHASVTFSTKASATRRLSRESPVRSAAYAAASASRDSAWASRSRTWASMSSRRSLPEATAETSRLRRAAMSARLALKFGAPLRGGGGTRRAPRSSASRSRVSRSTTASASVCRMY